MHVTKGLIIADPWIEYILNGSKTWEMRSTETSVRGPFALIRKGTGAIWGIATLVDVGHALTPSEMIVSFERHRIPGDMIRSGQVAKWNIPWRLSDIRLLVTPVPYDHPSGAVTWVNLAANVSEAIADQLEQMARQSARASAQESAVLVASPGNRHEKIAKSSEVCRLIAQSKLTEGNIKNHHFYLRGHLDRFPSDLVGGSNKDTRALKDAVIDWGGANLAITDIDGQKQFFRGRGWIKQFFETRDARPGDYVLVEETAPYRYKISLKKA